MRTREGVTGPDWPHWWYTLLLASTEGSESMFSMMSQIGRGSTYKREPVVGVQSSCESDGSRTLVSGSRPSYLVGPYRRRSDDVVRKTFGRSVLWTRCWWVVPTRV